MRFENQLTGLFICQKWNRIKTNDLEMESVVINYYASTIIGFLYDVSSQPDKLQME